jgi:hypothetical protein
MVTPNGQEGDSSGADVCGRIMEVALISSVVYYPLTLTRDTNGSDIVNLRRLIFLYLINVNITTRRRLDVKHGRLRVSANFPQTDLTYQSLNLHVYIFLLYFESLLP